MSFTPLKENDYPTIDLKTFTKYSGLNKIPESIAKNLALRGVVDLFPFKIVSLKFLIDQKRARYGGCVGMNAGWYNFFQIMTYAEDDYIGTGDILIIDAGNNTMNTFEQRLNTAVSIPVLLVKNDPKYCKLMTAQNDKSQWVWDSHECDKLCNWAAQHKVPNNIFEDFVVLGHFWTKSGKTFEQGDFANKTRVSAAINPKYLVEISSSLTNVIWDKSGSGSGCTNDWTTDWTSPFGTFYTSCKKLSWNTDGKKFWDIKPEALILQCCANTADNLSQYCGSDNPSSTNNTCDSFMVSACKGNNLLKNECISYCKQNNGKCDAELQKFCQSSADMVEKHPDVCSCFMTPQWYDYAKTQLFSSNPMIITKLKEAGAWGEPAECSFPQCQANSAIKPSRTNSTPCRNLQIQNCINNSTLSNSSGGTFSVKQLDQSQANNCVQSSTTTNVQAPTSTPSTTPSGTVTPTTTTQTTQSSTPPLPSNIPSSLPSPTPTPTPNEEDKDKEGGSKTWLWVGIGVTIFIIFLIILIILLRR